MTLFGVEQVQAKDASLPDGVTYTCESGYIDTLLQHPSIVSPALIDGFPIRMRMKRGEQEREFYFPEQLYTPVFGSRKEQLLKDLRDLPGTMIQKILKYVDNLPLCTGETIKPALFAPLRSEEVRQKVLSTQEQRQELGDTYTKITDVIHALTFQEIQPSQKSQLYTFSPQVLQDLVSKMGGFGNGIRKTESQIAQEAKISVPRTKVSALDVALASGILSQKDYDEAKKLLDDKKGTCTTHVTIRGYTDNVGGGSADEYTRDHIMLKGVAAIVDALQRRAKGEDVSIPETISYVVSPLNSCGRPPSVELLKKIRQARGDSGKRWLEYEADIIREMLVAEGIVPDVDPESGNMRTYIFEGDSRGGALAALVAHEFPQIQKQLIMRNPVGFKLGDGGLDIRDFMDARHDKQTNKEQEKQRYKLLCATGKIREMVGFIYTYPDIDDAERYVPPDMTPEFEAWLEYRSLCATELMSRMLGKFQKPANCDVQVMIGREDPLANYRMHGTIDHTMTSKGYSDGGVAVEFVEGTHKLPITEEYAQAEREWTEAIQRYLYRNAVEIAVSVADSERSETIFSVTDARRTVAVHAAA